jgi:TonB family protein
MSMRLILLLLLAMTSNLTKGQVIVKEFFTKKDERTVAANSYYYRVGEKVLMELGETERRIDTVFIDTVKTFYTYSNKLRSRSFYQDGYEKGPYTLYHENGKVQEKGFYKEGQKVGYITRWTENGTVKQTLQYFYMEVRKPAKQDSFKIINYWDESGSQLIKDGIGYCKCYLDAGGLLEEGKVVGGYKDSVWQATFADTLVAYDEYSAGKFLKGESVYKGSRIKYDQKFVMPEFKGGMSGMLTFLKQTIRYPSEAKRNGTQGRVFVRFVIDANGNVSDLEVVKGVSDALDRESIRVVKASNKKWIPAKSRGIPVKSTFVLPVYFKLEY